LAPAGVIVGAGWSSNQFTSLLLVYSNRLALSTGTVEALFGVYALGLVPGLLLAGLVSDARGRRKVVVPAVVLMLAASVVLAAAGHQVALLFLGRLITGFSSGAIFAAGTAWLRETSLPPFGTASPAQAARRAAVSMTAGFGLGPLVAGALAQWAPSPTVVPYLPHIALMLVVAASVARAPETLTGAGRRVRIAAPAIHRPRFRQVVMPLAPWAFAAPAVAQALLPDIVGAGHGNQVAALPGVAAMLTSLAGVLVQPLARRLEAHSTRSRAGIAGLVVLGAGLALGALAAKDQHAWLVIPCALILGAAYGLCLVAGLVEVSHLADQDTAGGLTAVYYALGYLGFGVPYLFTLAAHLTTYPVLLLIAAALALATAASVSRFRIHVQDPTNQP
jgi:MFS family permease